MVNVMAGSQDDQTRVLDFLALSGAYPDHPATIERIDTHASIVFLAGTFAYKVKRAVRYPFLDFSTLAKRHRACLDELRINKRTAPQLYIEVVPITLNAEGLFAVSGEGKVVEWALRMRRFDQASLYDRMASEARLTVRAMRPLAAVIAAFHASADRCLTPEQAILPLEGVIADNDSLLAANADVFPALAARVLTEASRKALETLSPLLESRARGGYVRHCHGDLHLRNIVEVEGKPVLFDAIEFDEKLATIDVLYDLAFLLMDLGKRGLVAHANEVLNSYLDEERSTGNLLGLAALPLFLSMRAMIRAKVHVLRASRSEKDETEHEPRQEARAYFELARNFIAPPYPARLVAIGGLSGTGKSAVSRAIAPHLGAFPGAVRVRSDVERKRLFGVTPETKLPPRAYTAEVSGEVYAMCRKRARLALRAGRTVIVDAVHAKLEERAAIEALAAQEGASFTGLWLEAGREVMRARVAKREGDVSDSTPSVVDEQLSYEIGPQSFEVIDANLPLERVVASSLDAIGTRAGRLPSFTFS
jgi:aminoglycoside phosphotransferase family enzyme/predicted kinase